MADDNKVPVELDMFVVTARFFKDVTITPPGDPHVEVDDAVRAYDPRLTIKFSSETYTFWLCKELDRAPGLYFPIEDIGYDPKPDETVGLARRMKSLAKRSREVAANALVKREEEYEARAKACAQYAMPGIGEKLRRLDKCDDPAIQRALAREMRTEVRRDQNVTPAPQ